MTAATRESPGGERMITMIARAGGTSRGTSQPSGVRIWTLSAQKRAFATTQSMVSDLQCGPSYRHAWC